jgi:two-component system response regulator (stage 0 sporulation protein F)
MNTARAVHPPEAPPPRTATAAPVNRKVLHIEDHDITRRLIERLLGKLRPQTELHVAANAREGIKAAIGEQPALILLDNRLPDATGAEVLRQLAAAEAAGIPVVIISGDSIGIGDELLAIGAAEFLVKPFDIHQFLAVIDRYIP